MGTQRAGSKKHAKAKKQTKRETKGTKPKDKENPEALEGDAANSLFGKKRKVAAAAAETESGQPKKRVRPEPLREDPAAAALRSAKKQKREGAAAPAADAKKKASPAASKARVKPHSDAAEKANRLWERLRSEKTPEGEREQLIDEVLSLFAGKLLGVLQKHDAARVLQSCFKQGTPAQRDALMGEIAGEACALARSHYGHFLLLSVLRHGATTHKQQLLTELRPHAAELIVHAEGSAVLQLLYSDVATPSQRHGFYRALWGKEMALLFDERAAEAATAEGGAGGPLASLADLFATDPLCRARVLRRLEVLLSKAARKGLALTALVQRAGAELLEHGEPAQKAELVGALRDQAVHMMHTRDGARIACGCLRYGDAKDRKALLKLLKGYTAKAAQDAHGALVLCAAFETVDDTVLLSKGVLAELLAELPDLAPHAHGALPLLQVLAPRSKSYFTPEQLAMLGAVVDDAAASSKKDPAVRRAELLRTMLPEVLKQGAAHAGRLARSPRGGAVLFEAIRVATEQTADGATAASLNANPADVAALFSALAAAAPRRPDGDEAGQPPLVADPIGARLLKRLAQAHAPFADELFNSLAGELARSAQQGGGWVVLALLESPRTGERARAELTGAVAALRKCSAVGCRSLAEVLAGKGSAGATGDVSSKAPAGAEAEAATAKGKPAKSKAAPKGAVEGKTAEKRKADTGTKVASKTKARKV